jgi:hypothetical protein
MSPKRFGWVGENEKVKQITYINAPTCGRCGEDIGPCEDRINVINAKKNGRYMLSTKKIEAYHEVCWAEIEDLLRFIEEHEKYDEEEDEE